MSKAGDAWEFQSMTVAMLQLYQNKIVTKKEVRKALRLGKK